MSGASFIPEGSSSEWRLSIRVWYSMLYMLKLQ